MFFTYSFVEGAFANKNGFHNFFFLEEPPLSVFEDDFDDIHFSVVQDIAENEDDHSSAKRRVCSLDDLDISI